MDYSASAFVSNPEFIRVSQELPGTKSALKNIMTTVTWRERNPFIEVGVVRARFFVRESW